MTDQLVNTLKSPESTNFNYMDKSGFCQMQSKQHNHPKTNNASTLFLTSEFEVETHHHAMIYKSTNPLTNLTEQICFNKGINGTFIPAKPQKKQTQQTFNWQKNNQQESWESTHKNVYQQNNIGKYLQFRRKTHDKVNFVSGKTFLSQNTIGFATNK